jgi:hypothetical protein
MHVESSLSVRAAVPNDVQAIVALTHARRTQLAAWEPQYWNPRDGIDDMHPLFLGWNIEHNPHCDAIVAIENDVVVGCVFVQHHSDHAFLDDLCVANERWSDVGRLLSDRATGDSQLICAPAEDSAQHEWLQSSRFAWASSYFSLRPDTAQVSEDSTEFMPLPTELEPPPAHTFGNFDGTTDDGLRVSTAVGYAIGSAPLHASAYDPGGPTTIIDRVCGTNRRSVVSFAGHAAIRRCDAQLVIVVDRNDEELAAIVSELAASRPVNVWQASKN